MKKVLTITVLTALMISAVCAQTNNPPSTNSLPTPPAFVGGLEQVLGVFGGQAPTNISVGPFATADTHGKNWGYGIALDYNLNNNIAFGLVMDSIPDRFTLFTGQVVFKLPVYPLAWTKNASLSKFELDPFAFSGVGKGIGNSASTVSLVAAAGVNVPIVKVFGGEFSLAGWYENLTGAGKYSGNRIGICPNWHKSF